MYVKGEYINKAGAMLALLELQKDIATSSPVIRHTHMGVCGQAQSKYEGGYGYGGVEMYHLTEYLSPSWYWYSGSRVFPVPTPAELGQEDEGLLDYGWRWTGQQLDLRRDLVQHMLDKLEEMDENGHYD